MARDIRLAFETLRTAAFGTIMANYTIIGSVFEHPIRILIIQNLTDKRLLFSLDGVNDTFVLQANSERQLEISTNKITADGFFASLGSGVYVKRDEVPGAGAVYVSALYGAPNS